MYVRCSDATAGHQPIKCMYQRLGVPYYVLMCINTYNYSIQNEFKFEYEFLGGTGKTNRNTMPPQCLTTVRQCDLSNYVNGLAVAHLAPGLHEVVLAGAPIQPR